MSAVKRSKNPRKKTQRDSSAIMRAIKSQNTGPERKVRSLLFSLGYRYRIHLKGIPGRPDIAFPKTIFVHGCFWHQHPAKTCPLRKTPRSNLDYWLPKLARNKARDLEQERALKQMGWKVLAIWECELGNLERVGKRVLRFLKGKTP